MTSDAILPRAQYWLGKLWASVATVERVTTEIQFSFYLFVRRTESDSLAGHLACVSTRHDPLLSKLNELKAYDDPRTVVSGVQDWLSAVEDSVAEHNRAVLERDYQNRHSRCVLLMPVEIRRDGVTQITIPAAEWLEIDECKLQAEQSFFFLKDISHVHQHHEVTSECHFTLHEKTSEQPDRWATEIAKDLQRAIVTARRSNSNPEVILDAIGVGCYARSFAQIAKLNHSVALPDLSYEKLEKSVEIVSAKRELRSKSSDRYFATLVGALTILIALAGSYHIMVAAASVRSGASAHEHFIWPIKFLAERLFEWDTTHVAAQVQTTILWSMIGALVFFSYFHQPRQAVSRYVSGVSRAFARLQLDSPRRVLRTNRLAIAFGIMLVAAGAYGLQKWLF